MSGNGHMADSQMVTNPNDYYQQSGYGAVTVSFCAELNG